MSRRASADSTSAANSTPNKRTRHFFRRQRGGERVIEKSVVVHTQYRLKRQSLRDVDIARSKRIPVVILRSMIGPDLPLLNRTQELLRVQAETKSCQCNGLERMRQTGHQQLIEMRTKMLSLADARTIAEAHLKSIELRLRCRRLLRPSMAAATGKRSSS